MQVICGLGGIGKTTLSVQYAWDFQSDYPGGVFWMSAETNDALEDSLQKIALDTDNVGHDGKDCMRKTLSWMSKLKERWLLIIDNLDMEEMRDNIKELVLGAWRLNSKGHIIISSRREAKDAEEEFKVKLEDCITLDVLSKKDSLLFMAARTGITELFDESASQLVEELGCLPLALEQAGAHIKSLSCTYKEYFDKFKRLRIQLLKRSRSHFDISKERATIRTTWQLNFEYISKQSENEGLGTAAVTMAEIAAFLFADEIPVCIINNGSPEVCDVDLQTCFLDELGKKQICEILTRFSLFQRTDGFTLSIHRLVQEVMRDELESPDRKAFIFECATRMINKALEENWSPNDAVKEENIGKASLRIWSKLALHANTLRVFMVEFARQNPSCHSVCFNSETTKLFQASAVYHSLFQRQDEALSCQNQMLSFLTAVDNSENAFNALTCVKIPLLTRDRVMIEASITGFDEMTSDGTKSSHISMEDLERMHKLGNTAFKATKYQDAIQYYSQAIKLNPKSVNPRFYSNRSLAFIKIDSYENALYDAEKCIELDSTSWKAYCWKALAIAGLVRTGTVSSSWKVIGMAAAATAIYKNKECLYHTEMNIEYPLIRYEVVEKEKFEYICSHSDLSNIVLLLMKGRYDGEHILHHKSVQIIGIESDVEILNSPCIVIGSLLCFGLVFEKTLPVAVNVYFENVSFPKNTGQIYVGHGASVIFYKCYFANGRKGCDDYPCCKGGEGCANYNKSECKKLSEIQQDFDDYPSGEAGNAGVIVHSGGKAFLDKCELNRCGGGGTLSTGEGSVLEIRNSVIRNMRQMGVEARDSGSIAVLKCTIVDNQTHGVNIGPKANGVVWKCQISGNGKEGVWCGAVFERFQQQTLHRPDDGSNCIIDDNLIYQNGRSGLSLEGGSYNICKNRIFDNWLWGMMIKSRSSACISNNDIFENKCGGIRIRVNFSASVTMDGNTIRDHSGPAIHTEKTIETIVPKSKQKDFPESDECIKGEITIYNNPPILTTRNIFNNNDRGLRLQRTQSIVETCCYCVISSALKMCSKCRKAAYCAKECQENHWRRHKHLCKLIRQKFTIEMKMSEVQTYCQHNFPPDTSTYFVSFQTTIVPLPDLGEGTPPDRCSNKKFIVKVQLQKEYAGYNPNLLLRVYDQTKTLDIVFKNPQLYHLVVECGVLAGTQLTIKKLYCFASFKNKGKSICFHTESLPPYQHRW